MSLYDDDELGAPPTAVSGWSRGVQLMQSQVQLKRALKGAQGGTGSLGGGPAGTGGNLSGMLNKNKTGLPPVLAPVIDLKSKTVAAASATIPDPFFANRKTSKRDRSKKISDLTSGLLPLNDPNWTAQNEYDPLWPNDYHKIVAEMRDSKRNSDEHEENHGKRRYLESGRDRIRDRYNRDERGADEGGGRNSSRGELSGFSRRRDEEDDYPEEGNRGDRRSSRRSTGSGAGAAIAPPPSLTEPSDPADNGDDSMSTSKLGNNSTGLGVAAKIMAKYGYKHGQGLGRAEQGMSQALSVEKTSKRGGRIVHEKDRMKMLPPPPPSNQFGESFKFPAPAPDALSGLIGISDPETPPSLSQCEDGSEGFAVPIDSSSGDEYGGVTQGNGEYGSPSISDEFTPKTSITELMKNPSKLVMCKNMVGPGEVDADLEPEVKDECNGKYGDVISVVVYEVPNPPAPEEAVRIFIEFKRVESAIKAVVDLNGRFFGGREVKARFYDQDRFRNRILTD